MADRPCAGCDHPKSAHVYEPGFYDVRGKEGDCGYVGCPCHSYRPTLTPRQEDDNERRPGTPDGGS